MKTTLLWLLIVGLAVVYLVLFDGVCADYVRDATLAALTS